MASHADDRTTRAARTALWGRIPVLVALSGAILDLGQLVVMDEDRIFGFSITTLAASLLLVTAVLSVISLFTSRR